MVTFSEFQSEAPHIAEIFVRRHSAAGNLCLLGTLRSDGYPRISPLEPRIVAGQLAIVGMPGTTKFADLGRDPRFNLHTATVDTQVSDGDAKLWGKAVNLQDRELHERFGRELFEESGFDVRGEHFDPFYVADITGASALEVVDNQLRITIWKPGEGESEVRKS